MYYGKANMLARADKPMALPSATREPDFRWNSDRTRGLSVNDFLAREPIMGLLVIKDGVVQVERYQYDRKPSHRFASHSMGKSITSLAVGFALAEGKIRSVRAFWDPRPVMAISEA